jgi:hypothetical protein
MIRATIPKLEKLEPLKIITNKQETPKYYIGIFEPLTASQVIDAFDLGYHKGSIAKYLLRAGKKLYPNATEVESEIKDLMKAADHIALRIEELNKRR